MKSLIFRKKKNKTKNIQFSVKQDRVAAQKQKQQCMNNLKACDVLVCFV